MAVDHFVFKPLLLEEKDSKRESFFFLFCPHSNCVWNKGQFEIKSLSSVQTWMSLTHFLLKLFSERHNFENTIYIITLLLNYFSWFDHSSFNLHWTVRLTTLLFPDPSLLLAWQEYIPEKEISKVKIISNEPNVNWKLLQNFCTETFF